MAGIPFLHNIDLNKNQLLNAKLHTSGTAPSSPGEGQIWYDSTNDLVKTYNGSSWNTISGDITGVTSATTNQLTVANSGGPAPAFSIVTAAIADGGTGLATADQIHTFVTGASTSGTAAIATTITVADESTDTTCFPLFATAATGNLGPKSGTNLTFNSATGNLTATLLTGTLQTAAQTNITSLGTLTTLTVDNVIINGTTIGHTGDTDLMTVASGVLTVAGEVDAISLDISGNVLLSGNSQIEFGDTGYNSDGDMQMRHDGTNGYIYNKTGDFYIRGLTGAGPKVGCDIYIQSTEGDNSILIKEDQGVLLYYNASKKFETTNAGATVTGALTVTTNIDVDGTSNLDNTDIDGTLAVDGTTISLDATTSLNIDNSNTSNGITIGTVTSGVPITIGHATSETTIQDNLTVTGDLTVNGSNTIVDSTTVAAGDNMFKFAKDNSANSLDIGWYGKIVSSGTKYPGIWYDASTGISTPKFNIGIATTEPGNTATIATVGTLVGNLEGDITGDVTGDVTGNAATATALATGRTIGMTGDVVWTSPSFDGSGNVTAVAAIQPNSVTLGTDTTGDYVSTITATTNGGITTTGATSGEGVAHALAVDFASGAQTITGTQYKAVTANNLSARSISATIDKDNSTFASTPYKATIQHGLITEDVIVQLFDSVTKATVYADVVRKNFAGTNSTDKVTVTFASVPTNDIEVLITSIKGANAGTVTYA